MVEGPYSRYSCVSLLILIVNLFFLLPYCYRWKLRDLPSRLDRFGWRKKLIGLVSRSTLSTCQILLIHVQYSPRIF